MAQFGLKVAELLRQNGKDAAWLATQTGIANSTISNWLSDPDVQPLPSSVGKVANAFGITADELSDAAGYVIRHSKDDNERTARREELITSSPRWATALDRLATKPAQAQDTALSMIESYLSTLGE